MNRRDFFRTLTGAAALPLLSKAEVGPPLYGYTSGSGIDSLAASPSPVIENYTQIFKKDLSVSDTLQTLDIKSPSPFSPSVPQLQIAWDSVSMGLFKECPRKYFYTMILGRGNQFSIHLDFGVQYHKVLENFDRALAANTPREEAVKAGVRHALSWDDGPYQSDPNYGIKNRFTLARTFFWYTEQFADDTTKTVILSDGSPAVELSFRLNLSRLTPDSEPYMHCGHLDRLVEFHDDYWFMDRKTTKKSLDEKYFSQYTPNTQMTGYFFASQHILKKPAKGGIVDAAQLLANGSRFQRHFLRRSEEELEDWLEDTYAFLSLAEQYAERGHWPMNDQSCNNYGGCAFRKICSMPKSAREIFLAQQYEERHWNPLEVREG